MLEAIKINLAENRKPRKIVPTSRANIWCPRCRKAGHFANESSRPAQRRIHYVNPEEEIYYTIPEEKEDEVVALVFQVHPTYGRRKAPQQPLKTNNVLRPIQTGPSQGMISQPRYSNKLDHRGIVIIVEARITMPMFVLLRDRDKVLH